MIPIESNDFAEKKATTQWLDARRLLDDWTLFLQFWTYFIVYILYSVFQEHILRIYNSNNVGNKKTNDNPTLRPCLLSGLDKDHLRVHAAHDHLSVGGEQSWPRNLT